MKKIIMLAAVFAMLTVSSANVLAGDKEWATAGKILTGIAAVGVLSDLATPSYSNYNSYYYDPAPAYYPARPVYSSSYYYPSSYSSYTTYYPRRYHRRHHHNYRRYPRYREVNNYYYY